MKYAFFLITLLFLNLTQAENKNCQCGYGTPIKNSEGKVSKWEGKRITVKKTGYTPTWGNNEGGPTDAYGNALKSFDAYNPVNKGITSGASGNSKTYGPFGSLKSIKMRDESKHNRVKLLFDDAIGEIEVTDVGSAEIFPNGPESDGSYHVDICVKPETDEEKIRIHETNVPMLPLLLGHVGATLCTLDQTNYEKYCICDESTSFEDNEDCFCSYNSTDSRCPQDPCLIDPISCNEEPAPEVNCPQDKVMDQNGNCVDPIQEPNPEPSPDPTPSPEPSPDPNSCETNPAYCPEPEKNCRLEVEQNLLRIFEGDTVYLKVTQYDCEGNQSYKGWLANGFPLLTENSQKFRTIFVDPIFPVTYENEDAGLNDYIANFSAIDNSVTGYYVLVIKNLTAEDLKSYSLSVKYKNLVQNSSNITFKMMNPVCRYSPQSAVCRDCVDSNRDGLCDIDQCILNMPNKKFTAAPGAALNVTGTYFGCLNPRVEVRNVNGAGLNLVTTGAKILFADNKFNVSFSSFPKSLSGDYKLRIRHGASFQLYSDAFNINIGAQSCIDMDKNGICDDKEICVISGLNSNYSVKANSILNLKALLKSCAISQVGQAKFINLKTGREQSGFINTLDRNKTYLDINKNKIIASDAGDYQLVIQSNRGEFKSNKISITVLPACIDLDRNNICDDKEICIISGLNSSYSVYANSMLHLKAILKSCAIDQVGQTKLINLKTSQVQSGFVNTLDSSKTSLSISKSKILTSDTGDYQLVMQSKRGEFKSNKFSINVIAPKCSDVDKNGVCDDSEKCVVSGLNSNYSFKTGSLVKLTARLTNCAIDQVGQVKIINLNNGQEQHSFSKSLTSNRTLLDLGISKNKILKSDVGIYQLVIKSRRGEYMSGRFTINVK